MDMDVFWDIKKYIMKQGCWVKCYKNKHNVEGSNAAFHHIPHPEIVIAIKGRTLEDIVMLLIHEYCHYLQFKEDQFIPEYERALHLNYKISQGKRLSDEDIEYCRQYNAHMEYDCDLRTIEHIDFFDVSRLRSPEEHLRYTNAYNRHIAWSIGEAGAPGRGRFLLNHTELRDILFPNGAEVYTIDQALAPCSERELKLIERFASERGKFADDDYEIDKDQGDGSR